MNYGIMFLAAWVLVAASASRVAAQAFYLEGEIPAAFDWNGPLTTENGPLQYRGIFAYEPSSSLVTFEILVGGWASTDLLLSKLYEGVVEDDAARLIIDLTSLPAPETWITSFELALDKATGKGEWVWSDAPREACTPTVCAPSVPGSRAVGKITAFRAVPEPGTLAMTVIVAVLGWLRRR